MKDQYRTKGTVYVIMRLNKYLSADMGLVDDIAYAETFKSKADALDRCVVGEEVLVEVVMRVVRVIPETDNSREARLAVPTPFSRIL